MRRLFFRLAAQQPVLGYGECVGLAEEDDDVAGLQRAGVGSGEVHAYPAPAHGAHLDASQAQREWAALTYDRRAAVLRKAGQLFLEHEDEINDWLVRESGAIRPFAGFGIPPAPTTLNMSSPSGR